MAAYISIIFWGNWHHINQQGIFYNEYLAIAKHLLNGDGYVIHTGIPVLYPICGYTLFTLIAEFTGSPLFVLALFQFFLCIISISLFYKFFNLEKRYWHILLFTPFIALLSVRWPDAIVGTLLIVTAYYINRSFETSSKKDALLGGLLLGIILNFRSEYLGLLVFLMIIAIGSLLVRKKELFYLLTLIVIPASLILLPWAYYSYSLDKHIRLTATNGGGVLYISLGQLPENPWGIVHSDSVAYAVSKQNGIDDPYSVKGDSLLTAKFIDDIDHNPIAFSEKVGYNLLASLIRGVYIGEYDGLVQIIVKVIFTIVFNLLLLFSCLYFLKHRIKRPVLLIVSVLIIYKYFLISFIQYEPRHMNAIYLFMLGISLLYLRERVHEKKTRK
ncbi:MAG: hypothetical protein ACHQM6_00195 [Candidatus Kapaibacterium sp.]